MLEKLLSPNGEYLSQLYLSQFLLERLFGSQHQIYLVCHLKRLGRNQAIFTLPSEVTHRETGRCLRAVRLFKTACLRPSDAFDVSESRGISALRGTTDSTVYMTDFPPVQSSSPLKSGLHHTEVSAHNLLKVPILNMLFLFCLYYFR